MNTKISMPYEDVFELIEWYRVRPPLWNGSSHDKLGKKEYKASITDLVISFQSRGKFYTGAPNSCLNELIDVVLFTKEQLMWHDTVSLAADDPFKILENSLEICTLNCHYLVHNTGGVAAAADEEDFTPLASCTVTEDGNVSPIPSIALSVSSPGSTDMASSSSNCAANGMVGKDGDLQMMNGGSRDLKRRKCSDDKLNDLISFLKDWQQQNKKQRRDEVDAFTDYIGNKLRRLPEGVRAHVEMEIHQIIYQAVTNHANL